MKQKQNHFYKSTDKILKQILKESRLQTKIQKKILGTK